MEEITNNIADLSPSKTLDGMLEKQTNKKKALRTSLYFTLYCVIYNALIVG